MRILFLPSWFPSSKNPYAGAFIKDLALDIDAEDIEIEVAAFHYNYTSIERNTYKKEELKNGVIVHHFFGWVFPKINIYAQKSWINTCLTDLEEHVEVGLFDFIHAHDYVATFVGQRISTNYNIPLISSFHHSDFLEQGIPEWRQQVLTEILKISEENICPSSSMKTTIEEDYEVDNLRVIPNYISANDIPEKKQLAPLPKKFIAITSTEKVKNNLKLLEFAENNGIELDIYGEIEKVLIHKVNDTKGIQYKGQLERTKLLSVIKEYDAFISMSEIETFGISIVECLCAGIPGLVYNTTGSKDYITPSNGIMLQEHDDPMAIFKKNYNSYNAKEIRENIISLFDKKHIIPLYHKLYRKLYSKLCVV